MIRKISFNNFKNKRGTQELTGFDMFTGENGVGKSAVIEAIELSLLGKIKDRKTPKDIFKLSRDDKNMSVGVELDVNGNREFIARNFYKKEKSDGTAAFSQKLDITFSDKKTIKEQEEEMAEILGTIPVSFDFNSFAALSNREKKDFILSFSSNRPELTEDEFRDLVHDRLVNTSAPGIDKSILIKSVDEMVDEITSMSGQKIKILEALEAMTTDVKDKVSYFRKDVDRCLKSQQKLADKRNSFGIAATKIALSEKLLEKKRAEFTDLSTKLNSLEYKEKLLTKEMLKKNQLSNENDKLKQAQGPDVSQVNKEISDKQAVLEALEKKYQDMEKEKDAVSSDIKALKEQVASKRDEFYALKEDGVKLKEKIDGEERLVHQVESTNGRCVINSSIPCHENFGEWVESKKSDILILNKNLQEKRNSFAAAKDALKDMEKTYEALHEKQRILNSESSAVVAESGRLNKEISVLMKRLEEGVTFDKVKNEKLSNITSNLNAAIQAADELTKEIEELKKEASQEKLDKTKDDIRTLQDEIAKKKEVAILTSQIEESMKEQEISEKSLLVFKYLQSALLSLKTAVFTDLIKPVSDSINDNLSDMGYRPFFASMDGLDFNFGLLNHAGDEIMFETLSTGQQAVLSCAMIAAFIENSDTKLKVFAIDNIESIDYANLEKVMFGLDKMKNRFDNIILSGCLTDIPMTPGVKLWNL